MSARLPNLAVVGATGAVGREMLAILEERRFAHGELRLLASARSAGTEIEYRGEVRRVEELTHESLRGIDIALLSAGSGVSRAFAPGAAGAGAVVIDNSSAFRMDEGVPLVIPEVNGEALAPLNRGTGGPARGGIIANPNCSTIILLMALTPLRRAFGVERVVVSTYQAASGAGAAGMAELEGQTRAVLAGGEATPRMFHEPYAFNLFSHNAAVDPATGLNGEERKMIDETRKIWGDPAVRVSPTCVRVPVLRAHAESVSVRLSRPATVLAVRRALADAPGVEVVDDPAGNRFPTPLKASGRDEVLVGRIRPDPADPETPEGAGESTPVRGVCLFVCADQLRKGAALNAVQIAEAVAGRGSV